MDTIIEGLREILGSPEFYHQIGSQMNYTWDYGAMIEYFVGAVVLCITVSSVFKIVIRWAER